MKSTGQRVKAKEIYKMTDADLDKVLQTVHNKIIHSVKQTQSVHLARLSAIQPHRVK